MTAKTPKFRPYNQGQVLMLPRTLEELVPQEHPVRVVNQVIDRIDISPLLATYRHRGTPSYHPQMLLKVLVYGYVSNIYSSRRIEASCKESVYFMWLSAMNYPDHNTINRFRGVRLKESLRLIFVEVVQLLAQEGLLSIEEVYTDGTKIEANANKYTFVWKKSIQTNKEKIKKALKEIWQYAQKVSDGENTMPEPPDFTEINSEKVQQTVNKLNEVLANKNIDKKMKSKLNYVKKNYPQNIERYEKQESILAGRNSYSKTDPDATFMRMKEDHMKNGHLKPGYNVQISSSNQYIVNYSIHPNPSDSNTLKSHIEQHEASLGASLKTITADAAYGNQENYELLARKNIIPYIKYGMFDKEQHKHYQVKHPFSTEKLHYNAEEDYYSCPMGQQMLYIGERHRISRTGFKQTIRRYQARNCSKCPLRGVCHQSKENRIIEININYQKQKKQVAQLLKSEVGLEKQKQRRQEVETIFGNIKQNHGFRRFTLRGKEKVEIEWGLLAIAQNIRKKAA